MRVVSVCSPESALVEVGSSLTSSQYPGLTATVDWCHTGTPLTMSPDSIRSPQDVDERSDLYAVGGIGFYFLAGRHVFEGDNVVEIFSNHLHGAPQRLSEVGRNGVPEDLEGVILRCLDKDPARRPGTAEGLAEFLGQCRNSGKWTREDARRWWGEHESSLEVPEPPRQEDPSGSAPTATLDVVLNRGETKEN